MAILASKKSSPPSRRTSRFSIGGLQRACAWHAAFEQLEIVAKIPAGPTYGDLRFNPCWDSLCGDQRFDKIVAAAKATSR